jgi:uncharacterized repeat protein (TIGR01451 family)
MRSVKIASGTLLVLFLLTLGLLPRTDALTGGPDPWGYTFTDSGEVGGPVYNWIEISGNSQINLVAGDFGDPDNGYVGPLDLAFNFPYYGRLYRQFYVYANGYVQLVGPGDVPGTGSTLPPIPDPLDPNGLLVPFSADLYLYPDVSHIYYRYDAANRRGIIEFLDMQWCCGLNAPHTMEIILNQDGTVLMQYQLVRFITNPHAGYVAGIEGPAPVTDTLGLGYAAGFVDTDDTVYNGLAALYRPGPNIYGWAFMTVGPAAQCEDAGMSLVYDADLLNLTGYTTTFDVVYAVQPGTWSVSVPAVVGPITNSGELVFPITVTIPASAGWDDAAQVWITLSATMAPSIVLTGTFQAGVADRDLVISKGLAPNVPPAPGGLFRYAVDVYNGVTPGGDCGADARDVVATEVLPSGMELVNVYPAPVTTPTQVITWSLGLLGAGNTATFYVEMRVPTTTTVPTILDNMAWTTMTGSLERGPFDNNVVTYTTVVTNPWLDLSVNKGVAAGAPVPGALLTYGIAYANGGNVPAPGALITDTLPQGITFVTATMPFSQSNGTLVWHLGELDNDPWNPGQLYATVLISPNLPDGFTLTNVAAITLTGAALPDVDLSNNVSTVTLVVQNERADVWADKLLPEVGGVPVIPEPAGDYTYWIHYGNDGSADAISVTLTDTLPLHTDALYASSAGGSPPDLSVPGLIRWSVPNLAAGASNWIRVTIWVQPENADRTVITNSIEITNALGYDITPTNNMDQVTATVLAADVTITETVIPTGVITSGTFVTYVIEYANVGSLEATGVNIRDFWPRQLVLIASEHSGADLAMRPGSYYIWDVEELSQGEGGTLTLTGWVRYTLQWPDPPAITNTVVIATSRTESSNNRTNISFVVNPVHVLEGYYIQLPLVFKGYH